MYLKTNKVRKYLGLKETYIGEIYNLTGINLPKCIPEAKMKGLMIGVVKSKVYLIKNAFVERLNEF